MYDLINRAFALRITFFKYEVPSFFKYQVKNLELQIENKRFKFFQVFD